jgi:hypothetical protein
MRKTGFINILAIKLVGLKKKYVRKNKKIFRRGFLVYGEA